MFKTLTCTSVKSHKSYVKLGFTEKANINGELAYKRDRTLNICGDSWWPVHAIKIKYINRNSQGEFWHLLVRVQFTCNRALVWGTFFHHNTKSLLFQFIFFHLFFNHLTYILWKEKNIACFSLWLINETSCSSRIVLI